ncbi:MAG: amidohydrolase family protein [Actinomycetales bacterium]|nr:amidohydrolase family protein [Actinomycetales bacterium]
MTHHSRVLRGARTLDPETGLDAVCDVAIDGTTISAVAVGGSAELRGDREVDLTGLVLAPGFIDLHSHCRDYPSRALQVCDGVTTALELEGGECDVGRAYASMSADGSPNHYGFSASWALARMAACGLDVSDGTESFLRNIGAPGWHRELSDWESSTMFDTLRQGLSDGALGIGVLLGYCQEAPGAEYLDVAHLAADARSAAFTHVRELSRPDSGLFGAAEVVTAALATGAHMHLCHINSTSTRHVDRVHALLQRGREQGLRISTEAYPYGAGCTGIGAGFLAPENLVNEGISPDDIRYLPTGERVTTVERLAELRAQDPGGLAVIDFLRETDPDDLGFLTRALLWPGTAVASDAMPLVVPNGGTGTSATWPIAGDVLTHPRTAGTFSRVLRWYVRELRVLDLPEAIRRCTLVPAEILEGIAPGMARKGRIQVGADADLVAFDPETVSDHATYDAPTRPSQGMRHVLVAGTPVVADGVLDTRARPGRPVRGAVL